MEKVSVGKETFKVYSFLMDPKGRLTLTGIAGFLQESAGNHAHRMGFGYQQMVKSGLIWVLTRLKILIHNYPSWSDELNIETWVVNREKYFSRRDFEIKSPSGKLLISAVSGWMLIDLKEKKPHLVDNFELNVDMFPHRLAIPQELDKIPELTKPEETAFYKVIYGDIDIVNHVNNTQYMRIILDSVPFDFRKKHILKTFEINYLSEAFINEELKITTGFYQNQLTKIHEIRRKSDDRIICRAISGWEND
ncbi:MAG: thioesterase [Bacteroidales bacterium]